MAKRRTKKQLRAEFKRLRDNAAYEVDAEVWLAEVERIARELSKGEEPLPHQWVMAAERATVKCGRCNGSGLYQWGACVNGKMTHSGPCFRCEGKGQQGQADFARNQAYDRHAIRRAVA